MRLDLTDAQAAANKVLLESDANRESEIKLLKRDLVSLEKAVREQRKANEELIAERSAVSAHYEKQVAQLAITHENELLRLIRQFSAKLVAADRRLASADKLLHAREVWLNEETRQAHCARTRLVATERAIADRDREIDELQNAGEIEKLHHANTLAELQHEYEAQQKYLRGVAEEAEQRAVKRGDEIKKLRAEVATQKAASLPRDIDKIRLLESDISRANAVLREKEEQRARLATTVKSLETRLRHAGDENAQLRQRYDAALLERVSAEEALRQSAKARNGEVEELSRENRQLQHRLSQSMSENESITQTYQLLQCEQSAVIADLRTKLEAVVEQATQFEALANQEKSRADELQTTLHEQEASDNERMASLESKLAEAENVLHRERATAAATESSLRAEMNHLQGLVEQRETESSLLIGESREQSHVVTELRTKIDRLSEESDTFQSIAGKEKSRADELQRRLADERASASEHVSSLESELATSQVALDRERANAASAVTSLRDELGNLEKLVHQRESELNELWKESDEKSREIDRRDGTIERLRLKNERLIEIQDSKFNSMRSQYEEMVQLVDAEKSKRERAEQEARRLSSERSGRITQLVRQNEAIMKQLASLREENNRLLDEIAELRGRPESNELVVLEQRIGKLRDRLQREAAERRKVEGVLKRRTHESKQDTVVDAAWSRMESEEQIRRLRNQIKSLNNVRMVERHRAALEIANHKSQIASLQRERSNRAA